jgi:hypothetical protein
VNNFIKQEVEPVIRFKAKFYAHEEASLGYNGIYRVLTGEWIIDSINVHKPIHIGPLRSLSENGIDNI